ncbi:hypothetical protein C8Q75DRAFT_805642 [Abortiporus biennis]|nr:hypothetical protein C8Q75DRAFT_805642 [Abortiporus biennis]
MRSSIFKAFVFASIFFGLASAVAIPESASDVDDAESLKVDGLSSDVTGTPSVIFP